MLPGEIRSILRDNSGKRVEVALEWKGRYIGDITPFTPRQVRNLVRHWFGCVTSVWVGEEVIMVVDVDKVQRVK